MNNNILKTQNLNVNDSMNEFNLLMKEARKIHESEKKKIYSSEKIKQQKIQFKFSAFNQNFQSGFVQYFKSSFGDKKTRARNKKRRFIQTGSITKSHRVQQRKR